MARLLLGVSGGIAAYKALETARLAVKAGHAVRVVQSQTSQRFVGAASFEAITGAPVLSDEFEPDPLRGAYPGEPEPPRMGISHLALVERADLYLIAPATANTLAKLAHGHADNLLTAGGTREPIDSVRYIGNRSSGRMGFALARQAARRGAEVTLVAANVTVPAPPSVNVIEVQTAAELAAACEREFEACDVLLMAAAVADFRPREPAQTKLKKDRGAPKLELEPTEDVLAALGARRRAAQVLVGFAAEDGGDPIAYGLGKLERKRLDAVVVNDISKPGIGFDADDNEVTIVLAGGAERVVPKAGKDLVADRVLDEVAQLRARKESSDRAVRADPPRITRV